MKRRELKAEIGQKFGLLTVIGSAPMKYGKPRVRLRCTCGNEVERMVQDLHQTTARIRSCGCASQRLAGGYVKPPYQDLGVLNPFLQSFYLGQL